MNTPGGTSGVAFARVNAARPCSLAAGTGTGTGWLTGGGDVHAAASDATKGQSRQEWVTR
jgi:hypothetical protein